MTESMIAFIIVNEISGNDKKERDKDIVYRLNTASIRTYRESTPRDFLDYGTVIFLEGGGRLNVKETVREIDDKIGRLGSMAVERIAGINM